jgi:hypothetical protein
MLKDALEDEAKMQKLAVVLDDKGYKKSADTIDSFRFDLWNYKSFPRPHWVSLAVPKCTILAV